MGECFFLLLFFFSTGQIQSQNEFLLTFSESRFDKFAFQFSAVDSCQDSDPYICPWLSQAVNNRDKCYFRFKQGYSGVYQLRGKQFHEYLVTKTNITLPNPPSQQSSMNVTEVQVQRSLLWGKRCEDYNSEACSWKNKIQTV